MVRQTVLVTGAAGFIGAHLSRRLLADGARVVGVDAFRGVTGREVALCRVADLVADPGFELADLDLTAPALSSLVRTVRPDVVFHLAGRPGARDRDVAALHRDNVVATAALVEAAEAADVQRLVLTSSSSVYGDAGVEGPCREEQAVAPLSAYAETKHASEAVVLAARLSATVVRLFTVYGPGQRPDMAFARFIAAARAADAAPLYQDLSTGRDFTYVADAVEGLVLAARAGVAPRYNISGGELVSLGRAVGLIEELTGTVLRTEQVEVAPQPLATRADLRLARHDLGYRPRVDLRTGLTAQVRAAETAELATPRVD